jgi:hypothetical protein
MTSEHNKMKYRAIYGKSSEYHIMHKVSKTTNVNMTMDKVSSLIKLGNKTTKM